MGKHVIENILQEGVVIEQLSVGQLFDFTF